MPKLLIKGGSVVTMDAGIGDLDWFANAATC